MSNAARLATIPTLPDLVPGAKDEDQRALSRTDIVADGHPVLAMLQQDVRRNVVTAVVAEVFTRTTAATAYEDLRAALPHTNPMGAFSEGTLDNIAATFVAAWFPQTCNA